MRTIHIYALSVLCLAISGCNKLVNVGQPRNTLVPAAVFADSSDVKAAILGMYASMSNTNTYGWGLSVWNGLYADDITSITFPEFATNSLTSSDTYVELAWSETYAAIYRANALIEGVEASTALTMAQQQQAIGEALVFRAFCHFYLVNLFDNIPLITSTDVSKTAMQGPTPKDTVYAQIIADLKQAITYLPADYSQSGGLRTRVNKYVAIALLARAYLYKGDWADAETQAGLVIGNGAFSIMSDPTKVFLASSTEAIWQWDDAPNTYTTIATFFVPTPGVMPSYTILPSLGNAFETGDLRKIDWIGISAGSYYPAKYKVATSNAGIAEYYTILRLAEQYLIRAEARAQENNIGGAQTDLNVIRNRAGLPNTTAASSSALLLAIEQERRVELFCEWGHRLLDLKRTGRADAVLGPVKAGWKSTDVNYPIPSVEIGNNPNLVQNQGY